MIEEMSNKKINITAENCVGCRICQLTCSFLYTKTFNPSKARINISEVYGLVPIIEFSDDCVYCGECANNCLYGALELIEGGNDE
jgi:anaerobic carbon-monoxide dehydrogenase iron sulfur subunit